MLRNTIVINFFSLITALSSLANQIIIAEKFGSSADYNQFLLITAIPVSIGGILTASYTYILIPLLRKSIKLNILNNTYDKQIKFILYISYVLIIIFFIFGFIYISLIDDYPYFNKLVIYILLWINTLLIIYNFLLSAYLNSKEKYLLPLLMSALPYLLSTVFIYTLGDYINTYSIIGGLIIGNIFVLLIYNKFNSGKFDLKITKQNIRKKYLKYTVNKSYMVIIAMLPFTAYTIVDSFWTIVFLSNEKISYISYAQRLIIAIGSLSISGPFILLANKFTDTYLNRNKINYQEEIIKNLINVALILIPILIITYLSSKELIEIIYKSGKFGNVEVNEVSIILKIYSFGSFFMLMSTILYRAYYSMNDYHTPMIAGIIFFINYYLFSGYLVSKFNIIGIAYAYNIVWILVSMYLLFKLLHIKTNLKQIIFYLVLTIIIIYLFTYLIDVFFNLFLITDCTVCNLLIKSLIVLLLWYVLFISRFIKLKTEN